MNGRRAVFAVIAAIYVGFVVPQTTKAAAPPANTPIGNQASATYTDASGTSREATSNIVTTMVQQVAAMDLQANRSTTVAPGGQVAFSHVVINNGNGADTFSLSVTNLTGDNFDLTGLSIYPDANQDGVPDNLTPIISTGSIPAGGSFYFVVVGSVPGVTSGSGQIRVTAVSTVDGTKTDTNTDTATISDLAVVTLRKSMSATSGSSPSGPYTVTLTYINTGNGNATNVVIRDQLPAGFNYVAGSGKWSISAGTALTDAADTGVDPSGIVYSWTNSPNSLVTATVSNVAPGQTAYVTFQVNVASGLSAQAINNTATIQYDPGTGTPVGPNDSNTVTFNVTASAGVTLDDGSGNHTIVVSNAVQGATVEFTNVVHNTGNATDTFDITYTNLTYPGATSFQLFQSDGNTPLVDSNGNGTPDTGPLAAGATYNVILKATLPPGATGGPFDVNKIARSTVDTNVTDTATDRLVSITVSSVDLYNLGGGGIGVGPGTAAITTNAINPGASTTFTLIVSNTSAAADSYDLAAATNNFTAGFLPAGWTVQFLKSSVAVLNTGVIPAGGSATIQAVVSVPAGAPPGATDIYFRALSPTTGAQDKKIDRVEVNTVRSISITPNNTGQVPAGGTVDYANNICNNGNVSETIALSAGESTNGWTSVIYLDANTNGVLDVSDPVITNATVAAGTCVKVFVKVLAPIGAPVGSQNVTTLTGDAGGGLTGSATDTSTVIASDLSLVKLQALDATCAGTNLTFGTAPITTGAIPGTCIRYRITATNNGVTAVTKVHVHDTTPAYTTRNDSGGVPTVTGGDVNTFTGPANGAAGAFDFDVGTLNAGASAVIEFSVKINQ